MVIKFNKISWLLFILLTAFWRNSYDTTKENDKECALSSQLPTGRDKNYDIYNLKDMNFFIIDTAL